MLAPELHSSPSLSVILSASLGTKNLLYLWPAAQDLYVLASRMDITSFLNKEPSVLDLYTFSIRFKRAQTELKV